MLIGPDVIKLSSNFVYIIDDDVDLRASLRTTLELEGYCVKEWPDARQFLDTTLEHSEPTVIVADMRMGSLSGLKMHQILLEREKDIPIIYISGQSNASEIIESMKLCPIDFLLKPFSRKSLLNAIQHGLNRSKELIKSKKLSNDANKAFALLSPREREVFDLLSLGKNNSEICRELEISLPTAKQYKSHVMRKLNLQSLAQLIKLNQIR